jgi:hypothetical protein
MKFSIILLLSLILTACNTDEKFDKTKWLVQSDIGQYPNRNSMINDLLNNHHLKGLSYKKLIDLIGEPAKNMTGENNEIYYQILTEYGSDIDPVNTKTLIIKLNNDSTIGDFKIDEWKK